MILPLIHELNEASKNKRPSKYVMAKSMAIPLIQSSEMSQSEIINKLAKAVGVKHSTALTYFHKISRETGLHYDASKAKNTKETKNTNKEESSLESPETEDAAPTPARSITIDDDGNVTINNGDLGDDEFIVKDDPNQRGIIRRVPKARLVYKRQNEFGTFDELWLFNTSQNFTNSLEIKRNIIAGTDIKPHQSTSDDGSQSYKIKTLGDIQYLEIFNLAQ